MCYRSNSDNNLLSLKMVFRYFKVQPRFHARTETSHFKSTLLAIGAKLPTTFFMFLRVPLTHLDRWLTSKNAHGITDAPRLYTRVQKIRDHIEKLKSDRHIHVLLGTSLDLHNLLRCEKTIPLLVQEKLNLL